MNQRSYFWFKNPDFTLRAIQILVVLQSFYMSVYVLVFAYRIGSQEDFQTPHKVVFHVLVCFCAVLLVADHAVLVVAASADHRWRAVAAVAARLLAALTR